MTEILAFQLLASFIVGGVFITALSLMAERASEHFAGIILMFPSTMVLGFFFLGLTTSAHQVSFVIPATLIPLGIVIFSAVIYIYCAIFFARYFRHKIKQVLATFIVSCFGWFILSFPFALWKFANLFIGTLGFVIIVAIAHVLLNLQPIQELPSRHHYTKKQILFRAAFTGSMIAGVVVIGKVLGPFWGAIFTMFPVATFSSLMIFHFYYQPRQLFYFMKKIPIGSASLFIYAISVMVLFPRVGVIAGTILSCCLSLLFSIILVKYRGIPIELNRKQ